MELARYTVFAAFVALVLFAVSSVIWAIDDIGFTRLAGYLLWAVVIGCVAALLSALVDVITGRLWK